MSPPCVCDCHTLAAAVTRRLRLSARALKLQASPVQVNIAKCFSFLCVFLKVHKGHKHWCPGESSARLLVQTFHTADFYFWFLISWREKKQTKFELGVILKGKMLQ